LPKSREVSDAFRGPNCPNAGRGTRGAGLNNLAALGEQRSQRCRREDLQCWSFRTSNLRKKSCRTTTRNCARPGCGLHGCRRGPTHRVPAQTLAGLAIRHDSLGQGCGWRPSRGANTIISALLSSPSLFRPDIVQHAFWALCLNRPELPRHRGSARRI
jgi:hypothetical protein